MIDLGLKESAVEVNFTFRHVISPIFQSAPGCPRLHIGVTAIRGFFFLISIRTAFIDTVEHHGLRGEPPNGRQLTRLLQQQARYGNTSTARHVKWEVWAEKD